MNQNPYFMCEACNDAHNCYHADQLFVCRDTDGQERLLCEDCKDYRPDTDTVEPFTPDFVREIESLTFLVRHLRCCRNCGNHWSANFEVCGLGEDTVVGKECRLSNLKNWRPMEYRHEKPRKEKSNEN